MQISLASPARKIPLVLLSVLLSAIYVGYGATEFLAAYFSQKPDLTSLQRAAKLQPGNAEYHYRVGRFFSIVQQSPEQALGPYRTAVALNPHDARYWFDLAAAYQYLGDTGQQKNALEHAITADPRTPNVAWEAANLYLVQEENDRALREFRVAMENDPALLVPSLQLCWRTDPDADVLLRDVIPPNPDVYAAFLDLLISKKETAGTVSAWSQLVQRHLPMERRHVFDYIRYLVAQHQPDQAHLVWQQAALTSALSAYQPSPANLVVNGDFSLDVLNGGFDWLYEKKRDVSLALDPTQAHTGHRSLQIAFDTARGIDDAGIRQLISVQPNTAYEFSAFFKSQDIEGAGGPRFAIQDLYSGKMFFESEDLKDVDFWKQVDGAFTTGPETRMVMLRVERAPAGEPIKGKLWIDGLRLVEAIPESDGH